MIDETLFEAEEKMEKTVAVAKEDFAGIRTGRAHPGLFSKIVVDYYGSPTPINQLASFHVVDARMISITPYDKGSMAAVERAIRDSDLGVNPMDDGHADHRGAAAGVHQGRQDQGRGRQGVDPQRPSARQGDPGPPGSRR